MNTTNSRRQFLASAGGLAGIAGVAGVTGIAVARTSLAAMPEPVLQNSPGTAPPLIPPSGRPYTPVVTLNG